MNRFRRMKKAIIFCILLRLPLVLVYSQVNLKGKITDSKGNPLPYASIGIPGTEYGAISEENGDFILYIKKPDDSFEVYFAALGFETRKKTLSSIDYSQPILIQLSPKEITLQEVTVTDEKLKPRSIEIGNGKSFLPRGMLAYDTLSGGSAMAILIDPSESEDLNFMTGASLRIAISKLPQFKVRFRMMDVDESNNRKPGKDLLNENIIIKSEIRKGWLDFDLRPYALDPKEPFYMVFEWILDLKDRKYIYKAYDDFEKEYPDRVHYDTVIVDGEEVIDVRINEMLAGTAFGVTGIKGKNEKMLTFTRANSFGEWNRDNAVLSAKATFSNSLEMDPNAPSETCQDLSCQIDQELEFLLDEYPAPGIQFSLSKQGYNIYSKGHGYRSIKDSSEVIPQTQFRIASVSKTMTAYALYQMNGLDSGLVDAGIGQFISGLPDPYSTITARQLANHTAGVPDYKEVSLDEIHQQKFYPSLHEALELFIDRPLEFAPGQDYLYSSYGYTLLGASLEKISGLTYLELMDSLLWQPQKMSNTSGDIRGGNQEGKSKFYLFTQEEGPDYDLSYSYSSGGLISTTDDLLIFGNHLLEIGYFESEGFKNSLVNTDMDGIRYGLGWYSSETKQGDKIYFHAGELPSSGSFILIHPESGVVLSLLANGPVFYDEDSFVPEAIMKILNLAKD